MSDEARVRQIEWLLQLLRLEVDDLKRRPRTIQQASESSSCSTSSPTTIGGSTEGSDTADTATWAAGDGAFDLWLCGRVEYSHGGDQKLYGFARKLSVDSCGKIVGLTAETRYEIDAPET